MEILFGDIFTIQCFCQNFGKICLKANGDTFCPMCGLRSRKGRSETWRKEAGLYFLEVVTSNRSGRFKILGMIGDSSSLCFCLKCWPLIRNSLNSVIGPCCNDFDKGERVFSFKATNLQHVSLKIEKRCQNLWWCSICRKLSAYFKMRSIQGLSKI